MLREFLLAPVAGAACSASWRRAGRAAGSMTAVNLVAFAGISVPSFWLALMLILIFAVTLGWLPAGGIATRRRRRI